MKLSVLAVLLVICISQQASADWRDDLKERHAKRLYAFVDGLTNVLQANANLKNTKAAQECVNVAKNEFENIIQQHIPIIDQCVASPTEQAEATKCCDGVRKNVLKEASAVSSVGFDCIRDA